MTNQDTFRKQVADAHATEPMPFLAIRVKGWKGEPYVAGTYADRDEAFLKANAKNNNDGDYPGGICDIEAGMFYFKEHSSPEHTGFTMTKRFAAILQEYVTAFHADAPVTDQPTI